MRLIFAGTPTPAAATLQHLLEMTTHSVVGVITRPDAALGRSKKLVPSPTAQLASTAGIPVLKAANLRDDAAASWITDLQADVAVVVAYGGLVPDSLLEIPAKGWLNVHYSLLPRWRGAAPVQHAIMAGDEVTGVTIFRLVSALDAGPIFSQENYPVERSTAGELLAELTAVGSRVLAAVLAELEAGGVAPHPQSADGITLAPKLTSQLAQIDWTNPACEIQRQIRGCHPNPMAWTKANQERLRILAATVSDQSDLGPAEIAVTKREFRIGTGSGDLVLEIVQPAGKKPMQATDWARGLRALPVIEVSPSDLRTFRRASE